MITHPGICSVHIVSAGWVYSYIEVCTGMESERTDNLWKEIKEKGDCSAHAREQRSTTCNAKVLLHKPYDGERRRLPNMHISYEDESCIVRRRTYKDRILSVLLHFFDPVFPIPLVVLVVLSVYPDLHTGHDNACGCEIRMVRTPPVMLE